MGAPTYSFIEMALDNKDMEALDDHDFAVADWECGDENKGCQICEHNAHDPLIYPSETASR